MAPPSLLPDRQILNDDPPETAAATAATVFSPPPPSFPLLELQPELIICIFKVLPPVEAVALSLCSKLLFSLGPRLVAWCDGFLDISELADLLTRLERDLVDTHVYCPGCMLLESQTALALREDGELPPSSDRPRRPRRRCGWFDFPYVRGWWPRGGVRMGYHLVRFVMNQYTRREKLGDITLDVFRGDTRRDRALKNRKKGEKTTPWNTSVDAKIIDGELYFHATHTVEIPVKLTEHPRWRSMSSYMELQRICIHQKAERLYEDQYHKAIHQGRPADMYFQTTSSCGQCLSDFTYRGRLEGDVHVFVIEGYHLLGSFLDDMMDHSWKFECFVTMDNRSRSLEDITRAPMEAGYGKLEEAFYPSGSIRAAWNTADSKA